MAQVGAILVIESGGKSTAAFSGFAERNSEFGGICDLAQTPLPCVEVLGRSVLQRTIERLRDYGVKSCLVLTDRTYSDVSKGFRRPMDDVLIQVQPEPWAAVRRILERYAEQGFDSAFVLKLGSYVEFDADEMMHIHIREKRPCTRGSSSSGWLDLWLVDCAEYDQIATALDSARTVSESTIYPVSGYVNPLAHPHDLRSLVVDAFEGRCELGPSGKQIRPRVWVDVGAQVHKRARIVAPAFIGRSSKVREDCAITRCSSVEAFCEVDYGTVVEDSSVLSHSYVGIWLDVAHSVVCGSRLFNLGREVTIDLTDSDMLRKVADHKHHNVVYGIPVEVTIGQFPPAPPG